MDSVVDALLVHLFLFLSLPTVFSAEANIACDDTTFVSSIVSYDRGS